MLLQSHAGFIHLLPALPAKWAKGSVTGLRARGGFEITDLSWADGNVDKVTILSTIGGNLRIRSNSPLKMADGTPLALAEGENSNDITRPYVMPDPIVVNPGKIPETKLPETYLYDIPTEAGQSVSLVQTSTAISEITAPSISDDTNTDRYNLLGQKVSADYKGVIITKGKKYINR